jgi:hypothetical protein
MVRSSNAGGWRPDVSNSRANYLAFIKLAAIRIWSRADESTPSYNFHQIRAPIGKVHSPNSLTKR